MCLIKFTIGISQVPVLDVVLNINNTEPRKVPDETFTAKPSVGLAANKFKENAL